MDAETNNSSDQNTVHVAVAQLRHEHDCYAQLNALYEQERQLLIQREFDALAQLLANKQVLLHNLSSLRSSAQSTCRARVVASTAKGLKHICSASTSAAPSKPENAGNKSTNRF
jgi:hypothetical protein